MSISSLDTNNPMAFARLMRLGQVSHAQGDYKNAHQYWRQAALIQPDNEQVWLALMTVVDQVEDRRVCIENVLKINPRNLQAQRLLSEMTNGQSLAATQPIIPDIHPRENNQASLLMIVILRCVQSLAIGLLLAIGWIASQYIRF